MIVVSNDGGFGALGDPKPQFSGLFNHSHAGLDSQAFLSPMRAWRRGGGGGGHGQ